MEGRRWVLRNLVSSFYITWLDIESSVLAASVECIKMIYEKVV